MTQRTLPKGWKKTSLAEVISNLETGSRPKGGAVGISNGIPSLSAEHMTNLGTFDFSELRYVPQQFYEQMSRGHIQHDDILIVKDGATTGKTTFVEKDFPFKKAVVNEHVFICRLNLEVVHPKYVFYFLWGKDGQKQIKQSYKGAAIGGINQRFVEKVSFPLPPLEEQERIAARLNEQMRHIEGARLAAEESLSAAWELPSAYLREVINKKSSKWLKVKLGDICKITAPQVDPKIPEWGNLPHINGENIESGTCQLLFVNTAAEDGMTSGKYLFDAGDVLYSKLRPYLRKVYVPDFRGVCSADMYPIKVDGKKLEPYYLAWLLVSDEFTKYADEESRRARMPKLNRDQLFAWETFLPPVNEQKEIIASLNKRIAETKQLQHSLESQLAEIESLPSAVLGQAFAGEI